MIDGASPNTPALNSFVNVVFCSECGGSTVQATRRHVVGESCLPILCLHNRANEYTTVHCARSAPVCKDPPQVAFLIKVENL
jgi:hypothetical protein